MSKRSLVLMAVLSVSSGAASADALEDGKVLLKQRQYKDAIAKLDEASRSDTTGEALYCLAIAYDLSGDAVKAVETYRKVADSKGKHAAEAERYSKAIEARQAQTTAVERARVDFERVGMESSMRLKEARDRVDAASTKLAQREVDANKVEARVTAAVAAAEAAEESVHRAERVEASWRHAAVTSPSDHGTKLRAFGTTLMTFGGIGIGASAWYVRTGLISTNKLAAINVGWTDESEFYSEWGPRSNDRLPYALAAGGGLFLAGAVLLGFGESLSDGIDDETTVVNAVERAK